MEPVATFSEKSWHGRLYSKYTFNDYIRKNIDICRYIRGVARGIWLAFLATVLATIVLASFELTIIGLITGGGEWSDGNVAITCVITGIASILGILSGFMWMNDNNGWSRLARKIGIPEPTYQEQVHKEPGFMSLAYRKFKDKVCFKVTVGGGRDYE